MYVTFQILCNLFHLIFLSLLMANSMFIKKGKGFSPIYIQWCVNLVAIKLIPLKICQFVQKSYSYSTLYMVVIKMCNTFYHRSYFLICCILTILFHTGFYVESSRPETLKMTSEEMAEVMKTDLLHGADGGDIKCGIIGEIGCSWPLGSKLWRPKTSNVLKIICSPFDCFFLKIYHESWNIWKQTKKM